MRTKLGDGGIGSILPGLGLMDAMEGRVRTDLSAIDLFLSSHLSSDRRVELSEEGGADGDDEHGRAVHPHPDRLDRAEGDYGRLQAFLAGELSEPIGSSASDAP